MDRKTIILAIIGILLILLFLFALLFFGKTPPRSSSTALLPSDTGTREFSPYNFLPSIFESEPREVTTPAPSNNSSAPQIQQTPQTSAPEPTFTIPVLEPIFRGGNGSINYSNGVYPSGTASGNYTTINPIPDGVTNPPQTNPRPNPGGIIYGGSGTDDDPYFEFDPRTGNMSIGDYRFSFAVGTIVDANTSNYTGDPDNMVFGQAIGLTIGSLFGSPSLGLTFGTAVGSNLYPGYRLSDFGISVNNGILSFDGDEFDENFGGGGGGFGEEDEEGEEGEEGAEKSFGGKAQLTLCSCPYNLSYIWEVTESPEGKYDGSYYLDDADFGFLGGDGLVTEGEFGFLGKYEENTSGTCENLSYPDCTEEEVDYVGAVVAEKMTCEDEEGETYDCYVTGTAKDK